MVFNVDEYNAQDYQDASQIADAAAETGKAVTSPARKALKKKAQKYKNKAANKAKKGAEDLSKKFAKFLKWAITSLISALGSYFFGIICIVVIIVIVIGGANTNSASGSGGAGMSTASYVPRLVAPVAGMVSGDGTKGTLGTYNNDPNKYTESDYYYSNLNVFHAAGYGMPNCTAYAYGRLLEITEGQTPNVSTGNAEDWWDYNQTNNYYTYGQEPQLGAVAVWAYSGGGHVAVVEVIDDTEVTYSNSAYQGTLFYTNTAPRSDPGNVGMANWTFKGFIYVYTDYVNTNQLNSNGTLYSTNPNAAPLAQKLLTYFSSKGLNKAACCGIIANVYAETSFLESNYFAGYVPDAYGAPGNSGGICMWYGDNCTRFKRDCPNWNTSVDAQIEYLYQTLIKDGQGTYSDKYYYWCTGCWSGLQSVPNTESGAAEAARIFCELYERPATSSSVRMNYGRKFYNEL